MTRAKRRIIFIFCLALWVICVWVPWDYSKTVYKPSSSYMNRLGVSIYDDKPKPRPTKQVPAKGYSLIWAPPGTEAKLDLRTLVVEILALTALGAALFVLVGAPKKKVQEAN